MDLVTDIYRHTRKFPKDELYGLTSQLRRAAVSVPSNLAEGHGRTGRREFHKFVGTARGSILEVQTQLEIACRLGYLEPVVSNDLLAKSGEVARMINGLLRWSEQQLTPNS
jgi:four helix bundle protein